MEHSMTEAEIIRAMTLLEEDEQAQVEKIQLGKWIVVNDRGVLGVHPTKDESIREALAFHSQSRRHCKVKRLRAGVYNLAILDIDEDPAEHYYHDYLLARIDSDNILRFQEIAVTEYLPDWYFSPYTREYQQFFMSSDDGSGEEAR